MDIVKLTQNLEKVIEKYSIDTSKVIDLSLEKSEKLAKRIAEINDENRLLKIGIIGRVKAGKSSLLNALFFDGEDILPKAATPMTAALTVLRYDTAPKAEIEFYDEDDLETIKTSASEYDKKFKDEYEKAFKNLQDIAQKKGQQIDKKDIEERAQRSAKRVLDENKTLCAYKEQQVMLENSNLSFSSLKESSQISADTMAELKEKLKDYVGADGKFTAWTKSVILYIDNENLKNVEIIDTPGVNDPIVSREERTKEFLKGCDVVLIVSSAGQFMSNSDMDLLERISTKDGIREILVVASQTDNQLYGSEKEKSRGDFDLALQNIKTTLNSQKNTNLSNFSKSLNSFEKSVFNINEMLKSDLILTSSASYEIIKKFDNQAVWDENLKVVWANLNKHYGDYFSSKESALLNLDKLNGVKAIKSKFDGVKIKKDEILKQRKAEFEEVWHKNIKAFQNELIKVQENKIEKIKSTDINELNEKIKNMQTIKDKAISNADMAYESLIEEFGFNTKERLFKQMDKFFNATEEKMDSSEGSRSYEVQVKRNWFIDLFSKKYETRYETTVRAGAVSSALNKFCNELSNMTELEYEKNIMDFKKSLTSKILEAIRFDSSVDEILDLDIIKLAIINIVKKVEFPTIEKEELPKNLRKSGELTGYSADRFLEEARDFVYDLQSSAKEKIKNAIGALTRDLKSQNIGKNIFAKYDEDINELKSNIENTKRSIEKFNQIIMELKNVDNA
ncbi:MULTISPECIES: dynamin family protein [unclassified Campylobacter]|uniref:dynamin family protein n=1 Tax=unclassified Campylobacter TaxID=2593542 RepID=UPI0022E9FBCE|nr:MULTISPECIES: dynamin family protein [unclassified Campylobacter]MDA3054283.1 dynamin family protein [Campylobacter sp. VBCF_07 NA4]MDA3060974.1 dynamin family protein [Campylobacter sp. VBCF_02 NA5]MDA3070487.1 dynamin family protein [Campylobacter sp. VBCF_08 NA3]WBR53794.1 dynamin family protein [Campylobacter sp. VBCF_01 NA2]